MSIDTGPIDGLTLTTPTVPADDVDAVVSSLLDLQDDLAAAVVWLAENWTTDLPALAWYGSSGEQDNDRPALKVIGWCRSTDLFDRTAAVLGAPVVCDEGRSARRRGTRTFGRVTVEVHGPLSAGRSTSGDGLASSGGGG